MSQRDATTEWSHGAICRAIRLLEDAAGELEATVAQAAPDDRHPVFIRQASLARRIRKFLKEPT